MAGYVLSASAVTLANQAVTVLWLNPIAAPNIDFMFRRVWIGQSNATAPAQQRVQLNTQVTAFPTLVSATPAKLSNVSGASALSGNTTGAAGTTGINASAEGAGAKTVIWPDTFSPANGWLVVFVPDDAMEVGAGAASGFGLHLPVAAGTLTNWTAGMSWVEG